MNEFANPHRSAYGYLFDQLESCETGYDVTLLVDQACNQAGYDIPSDSSWIETASRFDAGLQLDGREETDYSEFANFLRDANERHLQLEGY